MKIILKHFILIMVICLSACSKEDEVNNNFINPPDWIIGTWVDESEPIWAQKGGFTFTNDNLITLLSTGDAHLNLKESLQDSFDAGLIKINEDISETKYSLEIISNGTLFNSYKFSIGSNELSIIYHLAITTDIVLTKQ